MTANPLNGFLRITDPERARHFYERELRTVPRFAWSPATV
jgi:hypothetical protein